jgi:hypothetical protein
MQRHRSLSAEVVDSLNLQNAILEVDLCFGDEFVENLKHAFCVVRFMAPNTQFGNTVCKCHVND